MDKMDIIINRELFSEVGIDIDKLAKIIHEDQKKTNVNCMLYHKLKKDGRFNCPWPSQCVHRQGSS